MGYLIIPNRSTAALELFCKDYIQLGGRPFRIIVVDRLWAQFDALSEAFSESYIMFCLVHIRRNISTYFASNDEIFNSFDMVKRFLLMPFQYLDYLKFRFTQMPVFAQWKKMYSITH